MPNFYSPTGNYEVWEEKPDGYFTEEEWEAIKPPPQPPTVDDMQAVVKAAIQQRLDDFAQTREYTSISNAATYAVSRDAQFAFEGQYAVEARDLTWRTAFNILNDVASGVRPMPTVEEVMSELPELVWPDEDKKARKVK